MGVTDNMMARLSASENCRSRLCLNQTGRSASNCGYQLTSTRLDPADMIESLENPLIRLLQLLPQALVRFLRHSSQLGAMSNDGYDECDMSCAIDETFSQLARPAIFIAFDSRLGVVLVARRVMSESYCHILLVPTSES